MADFSRTAIPAPIMDAERRAGEPIRFVLQTRDGSFFWLGGNGRIIYDGARHMGPFSNDWRITGVAMRSHSRNVSTLDQIADGASVGHGLVHDRDHGTHRTWMMPTGHRAVSVRRVMGSN